MINFPKDASLFRKKLPIHSIWYYASIILISASLVAAALSYAIYTSHTHNVDRALSLKTASIEKVLSELLEETNRILAYAGRQLVRFDKAKDPNYIAKFYRMVRR